MHRDDSELRAACALGRYGRAAQGAWSRPASSAVSGGSSTCGSPSDSGSPPQFGDGPSFATSALGHDLCFLDPALEELWQHHRGASLQGLDFGGLLLCGVLQAGPHDTVHVAVPCVTC